MLENSVVSVAKMKISNIRKRWRDSPAARESVQLLIRIISLAAIFWFFFSYVFLLTRMEGNEMFPSLKDGDLLFAFRLQREYRSDDIIVYEVNGKESVGRIAAKEEDIVLLDSQDFEAISMDQVKGKVITLLRRRGI